MYSLYPCSRITLDCVHTLSHSLSLSRTQVLTLELEEAEEDISLLREELASAEEDRREMNAHIDKVENVLRAGIVFV